MNIVKMKTSKRKMNVSRKGNKRKPKHQRRHRRALNFITAMSKIKNHIRNRKPKTFGDAIKIAIKSANNIKKKIKSSPRIIKVPRTGGILPLIPIFAGLSALGALSGGAAGIAKAVNDIKGAREQLKESQRHNKTMEAIALGKGLYLRPYKQGLGIFS